MSAIKLVNYVREQALAMERVLHEAQAELIALESIFTGELAPHRHNEISLFFMLFSSPRRNKSDTVKLAKLALSSEWEITPKDEPKHDWVNVQRKYGDIEIYITIYTHD